jgi:hypothetical protein
LIARSTTVNGSELQIAGLSANKTAPRVILQTLAKFLFDIAKQAV